MKTFWRRLIFEKVGICTQKKGEKSPKKNRVFPLDWHYSSSHL